MKQLKKLDSEIQSRIVDSMKSVSQLANPRSRGKLLVGNLSGLWRYRVGNYRILCQIQNEELVILVVEIGHRKEIYNRPVR